MIAAKASGINGEILRSQKTLKSLINWERIFVSITVDSESCFFSGRKGHRVNQISDLFYILRTFMSFSGKCLSFYMLKQIVSSILKFGTKSRREIIKSVWENIIQIKIDEQFYLCSISIQYRLYNLFDNCLIRTTKTLWWIICCRKCAQESRVYETVYVSRPKNFKKFNHILDDAVITIKKTNEKSIFVTLLLHEWFFLMWEPRSEIVRE